MEDPHHVDPAATIATIAGVTAASIGLAMASVRLLDKYLPGRKHQESIICPNKVEDLPALVARVDGQVSKLDSHVRRVEEIARVAARDISVLKEQHKADDSGVERWKMQPEFKQTMEETRDTQRDMLGELRQLKALIGELVQIQGTINATLSKNAT